MDHTKRSRLGKQPPLFASPGPKTRRSAFSQSFEWVAIRMRTRDPKVVPGATSTTSAASCLWMQIELRFPHTEDDDDFINPVPSLLAFPAHPASRKLETLAVEAGVRRSHLHHDSFPFQDLPIWKDLDSAIWFSPHVGKLREVKIMKRTCNRPECLLQQQIKDRSADTWYFVDVDLAGQFPQCMKRGIQFLWEIETLRQWLILSELHVILGATSIACLGSHRVATGGSPQSL
ncbi:hypothetical protein B0H19DRAFT_1061806 [Mycena capillaripes]|nr:hypothetical protein B0H19DRAFT_1061806 [Mycena capillaripes]